MTENDDDEEVTDAASSHAHTHGSTRRLGAASAANVAFAVVQVLVGLAIGSVVVLADAAHQAVDALGLITALIAVRMSRRPATEAWTYGMGKADALGGFMSALLLLGSVAWIVIESIRRLAAPEEVSGVGVIVIGVVAIVVNGASVLLVGHGHEHDDEAISMRAARLHLLTDLAGSVVVVASGVLLAIGGPDWIDPVASLLLSAVVLWTTWKLIVSAIKVLLDRAPVGMTSDDIISLLMAQHDVDDVHHVHLRPLSAGRVSVTAHVVVDGDLSVHQAQHAIERLGAVLNDRHQVEHSTLQLECHDCSDEEHPM